MLQVAKKIGGAQAADKDLLKKRFEPKLIAATKKVVNQSTYQSLYEAPNKLIRGLKQELELDFGGYEVNKIKIAELKHMPLDEYDLDYNLEDVEGYKNLKKWLKENK